MSDSSESQDDDSRIPWIKRLWREMRREYGAAFDRQWQCPADPNLTPEQHVNGLMAHWERKLSQFRTRPHAIRYGLDNLPPHPPSLPEFIALCRQAPDPPMQALPDHTRKADPARLQAILATIPRGASRDPLACAQRHLERLNAGERLTPAQRDLVRKALPHVFDEKEQST